MTLPRTPHLRPTRPPRPRRHRRAHAGPAPGIALADVDLDKLLGHPAHDALERVLDLPPQAAELTVSLRIGERDAALLIDVQVSPRASKSTVLVEHDGCLKVALAAPPIDGAANRALIELLADVLGVPKRQVALVRGESSKRKTVAITGVTRAAIDALVR